MTILENVYAKGIERNGLIPSDWQTVTVTYMFQGSEDTVDFNIQNLNKKSGVCELHEKFKHFCQCNGYSLNSVISVALKKVTNNFAELL